MNKDKPVPVTKKETVVINLRAVPADLHRAIRHAAYDADTSMESYIVDVLCRVMNVNKG